MGTKILTNHIKRGLLFGMLVGLLSGCSLHYRNSMEIDDLVLGDKEAYLTYNRLRTLDFEGADFSKFKRLGGRAELYVLPLDWQETLIRPQPDLAIETLDRRTGELYSRFYQGIWEKRQLRPMGWVGDSNRKAIFPNAVDGYTWYALSTHAYAYAFEQAGRVVVSYVPNTGPVCSFTLPAQFNYKDLHSNRQSLLLSSNGEYLATYSKAEQSTMLYRGCEKLADKPLPATESVAELCVSDDFWYLENNTVENYYAAIQQSTGKKIVLPKFKKGVGNWILNIKFDCLRKRFYWIGDYHDDDNNNSVKIDLIQYDPETDKKQVTKLILGGPL